MPPLVDIDNIGGGGDLGSTGHSSKAAVIFEVESKASGFTADLGQKTAHKV